MVGVSADIWRHVDSVQGDHIISVTPRIIEDHLRTACGRQPMEVDPARIQWERRMAPPSKRPKTATD